jgi:hypothetical protein
MTDVACKPPAAAEFFSGCFGVVPVAEEHHRIRRAQGNRPGLAGSKRVAVIVDDLDLVPRDSPTH